MNGEVLNRVISSHNKISIVGIIGKRANLHIIVRDVVYGIGIQLADANQNI